MAAALRAHDWSATPLGPPQRWPVSLRTLVSLMLDSIQPMFMIWGEGRTWLYNDAFVPILGLKHPGALGRHALDEVWAEARADLAPLFDRVFRGEPVHMDDIELQLDRQGRPEEAHFAFSYNPVRDEEGRVVGLFGTCIETTDRVLAERRQAAAQRRQLDLFGQAPGFIAVLQGPQHRFEFVNEAYRRVAGGRDLLGLTVREAFPELAGQGYLELLDRVFASGVRYVAQNVMLRLRAPSGEGEEELYLDFIYEPVLDEARRVTGIFVEGHDVTAAHRAQQERLVTAHRQAMLVALDDRLRALDEPSDISFAAAELLGLALDVSRAGYGTVDLAAETITIDRDWNAPGIRSIAGVLHFRDYGSYIEDLKRGETVVFHDAGSDSRTAATADRLRSISAVSVINMPVTEHDGLVALLFLNHEAPRVWTDVELAFIREVAQRTRMAVERRRAERDLRVLADSLEQQVALRTAERDRVWRHSRDLLVVVGADGIFRAVNPAWTAILGHEPSDVVGRSFTEFVVAEDTAPTQLALDRAAGASDLTDFENRYRHRDGSERWISWHTAVEGDVVYAYGRDVTESREQARALQQAEDALRQSQKLEAMGQLTGGVAHDFNNLLAVVSNNVFLHRRLSPACEHDAQLAAIARATETGARLTRQLLAFSRRQAIRPESIALDEELPELRQVLQTTLGSSIAVTLEIEPGLPPIRADRSEFELAVINLAMNARDAMPQGGRLALRCRGAEGGGVMVEVEDSGEGIAPELLERVFEPFFTTKEPGRGTGLGLSQVYGFASQAGGRIALASRVGKGTTVTMVLPAAPGHASEPGRNGLGRPSAEAGSLDASILLVEDNADVGNTTRDLLVVAGCRVEVATTGMAARELLAAAQEGRFDLVLTDIVMPGQLNGVELARWIIRERPGLPVVLATGYSSQLSAAAKHGLTVLQKPVAPAALVEALRKAMEAGAQGRAGRGARARV